jgi:hypothetical protein
MPSRLCICQGCTGHGAHQAVFPMSANPGHERCPSCQRANDTSRPSRQKRGYDRAHELERERQLAGWAPGQPCALCGQPTYDKTRLDLAHTSDRNRWRGLAHDTCNRSGRYD